jgi:hypothetical protein
MPESNNLPERLRARLARGLDAVPELRPRPEQALYATDGRGGTRRRPPLALVSGAAALVALLGLTALAGLTSTGSANPAVWTGRALSEIHPAGPPAVPPTPAATPSPQEQAAAGIPPHVRPNAPTAARPPSSPSERFRPPTPPGFVPPTGLRLPRFSPPPFPTGYPYPSPDTSDFGHGGR